MQIFHAKTKSDGLHVLANGGRVLNVCALSKSMCQARSRAYEAIARIHGRTVSVAATSGGARWKKIADD